MRQFRKYGNETLNFMKNGQFSWPAQQL